MTSIYLYLKEFNETFIGPLSHLSIILGKSPVAIDINPEAGLEQSYKIYRYASLSDMLIGGR